MLTRRHFVTSTFALGASALPLLAEQKGFLLRDLYDGESGFSDLAKSLEGGRFEVAGFMAPPLKANTNFFVLTTAPMAICPFCEDETDWPEDILAVYSKRQVEVIPFSVAIKVRGVLELGTFTDRDTGFVSRVRLADATYERA